MWRNTVSDSPLSERTMTVISYCNLICYFILKIKLNYCCSYVYMQWVSSHLPRWLEILFTEKFFHACIIHEDGKKQMKRTYIAWTVALAYALIVCPFMALIISWFPHAGPFFIYFARILFHLPPSIQCLLQLN